MGKYEPWGRFPRRAQRAHRLHDRHAPLPGSRTSLLPFGNGRSYGDSCLNTDGWLLDARGLDRFIRFDPATGVLACEAGVLLSEILDFVVPQGWFLPVTPGTRLVTVGGAIANDVHGKNHHSAGTFGRHVRRLELLRSDGRRILCRPGDDEGLFSATVGGLGLTGLITWAEVQLRRIQGPWLHTETLRFDALDDFFALSRDSVHTHEYTVAWIDCLARGRSLGRGIFIRADHAPATVDTRPNPPSRRPSVPFTPPMSLVNRATLRPFNFAYYWRAPRAARRDVSHYETYFYPLDGIRQWNRMYGPSGFLQYQCVLPPRESPEGVGALLSEIAARGMGSFLAVLKEFGDTPSCGMLSFPRAGTTLALDFPNPGPALFGLLDRLDSIVDAAGGAVYPAKDARMTDRSFKAAYPRWHDFSAHIDPAFSSDFWRRVAGEK